MSTAIIDLNTSSSSSGGTSAPSSSSGLHHHHHHQQDQQQQQQQQQQGIHGGTNPAGGGGGGAQPPLQQGTTENGGTAAILARLKELEASNQALQKHVEEAKKETQEKDDKIKRLSAEKRKDMEQMIETAIDTWLNSLTGISDDVRKQFRSGVTRIAEHADMNNAAWEVVCQASELHRMNVNKIEELMSTCNEQSETIKSLVNGNGPAPHDASFLSEASRMMGGAGKRPRMNNEVGGGEGAAAAQINRFVGGAPGPSSSSVGGGANNNVNGSATAAAQNNKGDAWDLFDQMLRDGSRSVYF